MDLWVWIVIIASSVFAIGLVAYIMLFKSKKNSNNNTALNNIDLVIGEKCIVTERIDHVCGCGQARVNGLVWSARAAFEDDVFEEGEVLQIVAVEGVKLICKK